MMENKIPTYNITRISNLMFLGSLIQGCIQLHKNLIFTQNRIETIAHNWQDITSDVTATWQYITSTFNMQIGFCSVIFRRKLNKSISTIIYCYIYMNHHCFYQHTFEQLYDYINILIKLLHFSAGKLSSLQRSGAKNSAGYDISQ